ncbi:hypothetical protein C4571_01480 [Candidatus Parcubacteria bacterium]|nr:MAG: hypothetical protein C4571_01480 [Candidatus Parcubacteria bacterium]
MPQSQVIQRESRTEVTGNFFYRAASFLFLLAIVSLVWRRNHFVNFGEYTPTVKFTEVSAFLALIAVVLALIFSKSLRRNEARNALLAYWGKYFLLFSVFLAVGSFWTLLFLHRGLESIDVLQYGRIFFGMTLFFLALFLGFGRPSYARLLVLSFLSAIALLPVLFLSEDVVVRNYLIVSPSSYTLLASQPGTIVLGSFLIFPAVILFSLFVAGKGFKKVVSYVGAMLLMSLVLWTGSRAAWLGTLFGCFVVVGVYAYWKKSQKEVWIYSLAVILMLICSFLILPRLARNTVLVRVFPDLRVDVQLDRKVLEKIAASPDELTLDRIAFLWLRLPTRYYFTAHRPKPELGFYDGRGQIWIEHAKEAALNPLGLGPAYADVLSSEKPAGFSETLSYARSANAHNLWLQVLLSAGVGGLAVFLFMTVDILRKLFVLVKSNYATITLWLAGGVVGILINLFFIDGLELRWLWVLFALVVLVHENFLRFRGQGAQESISSV